MAIATELVARLFHDRLHGQLKEEIKLSNLFLTYDGIKDITFGDTTGNLTVLLGSLPELLPSHWVIGCLQVRCGFLGEDVLN